jgi:hypothetical protein
MKPDLKIWDRSGASKTVRINGWATVARDGTLGSNIWGTPFVTAIRSRAIAGRRHGEKVIRVAVTIKEGHV